MQLLLAKAQRGFSRLSVSPRYAADARQFLAVWLTKPEFRDYVPQIKHLISQGSWDYLLDSFYQVIPFGTGGRRGEVGVGPNRINPWTIKASAQGHAQYLLSKHGEAAKRRGVVFAYDVREFAGSKFLSDRLPSPVRHLTSRDLAHAAAGVYAAHGIPVHLFGGIRTTPELSFAIRYLQAVGGAMFSASHNPPDHNGKKVYDEFGGQLIPPEDEQLVAAVAGQGGGIREMPYEAAVRQGLIREIPSRVDDEYLKAAASVSLSPARGVTIAYTPLHGCGLTSVYPVLERQGFAVFPHPETSTPSGKFEHITFHIPNPEVVQSFDTTLPFASKHGADLILSSDPDADRVGVMVKHQGDWIFLTGNEIAAMLAHYVVQKKRAGSRNGRGVIIKTTVTTSLIAKICERNDVELIGELLVGFKYVAEAMNALQRQGRIGEFLLGCEESHGSLAGNYARDKDAVTPAVWLSELAAELKPEGKTLVDYLDQLYCQYGYVSNYLNEIRLLGAVGREKIDQLQASLRGHAPATFGEFTVREREDGWRRTPIVSETDRAAKDILIFHLEPAAGTERIKVTIRPSGTEPKVKMYFEIGTPPVSPGQVTAVKAEVANLLRELEQAVMLACYRLLGVDFPARGFLLFWQLPLDDKLKYFAVEPQIERLSTVSSKAKRREKFSQLVSFLGVNPVEKMDEAFKAKHKVSVLKYLNLA